MLVADSTPLTIGKSGSASNSHHRPRPHLFFNFPLGITVVVGGMGRLDSLDGFGGGLVSFLGFFTILLLRWSPLAMGCSVSGNRCRRMYPRGARWRHAAAQLMISPMPTFTRSFNWRM